MDRRRNDSKSNKKRLSYLKRTGMLSPHVSFKVLFSFATVATNRTLEWSFTGVNANVILQITRKVGGIITIMTLISFHTTIFDIITVRLFFTRSFIESDV